MGFWGNSSSDEDEDRGHTSEDKGDHTHETDWWNDHSGVAERESWDDYGDGQRQNDHYTQDDGHGTEISYNYDTGTWTDKSH